MDVVKFDPKHLRAFPDLVEALHAEGIHHIIGPAFTVMGTGVLAIGGLVPMGGGTCEAWFHCRAGADGETRALPWVVRKTLRDLMLRYGWRRVQARIDPSNALAVRFICAMGFIPEGMMRSYWHGQDRALYARLFR